MHLDSSKMVINNCAKLWKCSHNYPAKKLKLGSMKNTSYIHCASIIPSEKPCPTIVQCINSILLKFCEVGTNHMSWAANSISINISIFSDNSKTKTSIGYGIISNNPNIFCCSQVISIQLSRKFIQSM